MTYKRSYVYFSLVLLLFIVGLVTVSQQIPIALIAFPPSLTKTPPEMALLVVMESTLFVVISGTPTVLIFTSFE